MHLPVASSHAEHVASGGAEQPFLFCSQSKNKNNRDTQNRRLSLGQSSGDRYPPEKKKTHPGVMRKKFSLGSSLFGERDLREILYDGRHQTSTKPKSRRRGGEVVYPTQNKLPRKNKIEPGKKRWSSIANKIRLAIRKPGSVVVVETDVFMSRLLQIGQKRPWACGGPTPARVSSRSFIFSPASTDVGRGP